ncbi:MAG: hypothetical protein ACRC30_11060 [Clostridium sp.]
MELDFNKYRKYSKLLYKDTFDIKRYIEIEDTDGSEKEIIDPNPILKNIPCKLSIITEDEHKDSIDVNEKMVKYKIFCDVDVDIKKGDLIEVTRKVNAISQIIKGIASEPVLFNLNKEIKIIEKDEA